MINTNQVYPTKNMIKPRLIKSSDAISIDLRCYIRTMDHVISADESETVEIQMKMMDWARVDGTLWQSQHQGYPLSDPRPEDQI
jgi:hypothetical protein